MRIVVDSSALIANAHTEPERNAFVDRIATASEAVCSAVTLYEPGVVLIRNKLEGRADHAERLVGTPGIRVLPFAREQVDLALEAHRRYGKGLGTRPHLNFGDCISHALARSLSAPLLFKGDDFAATDVQPFG